MSITQVGFGEGELLLLRLLVLAVDHPFSSLLFPFVFSLTALIFQETLAFLVEIPLLSFLEIRHQLRQDKANLPRSLV